MRLLRRREVSQPLGHPPLLLLLTTRQGIIVDGGGVGGGGAPLCHQRRSHSPSRMLLTTMDLRRSGMGRESKRTSGSCRIRRTLSTALHMAMATSWIIRGVTLLIALATICSYWL